MSYYGSQGDYWSERAVPTSEVTPRIPTIRFGDNTIMERQASVGTQSYKSNDFRGFAKDKEQERRDYNYLTGKSEDKWEPYMARRGGKRKSIRRTSRKKRNSRKTRRLHKKK
jgi:hypothetical protein